MPEAAGNAGFMRHLGIALILLAASVSTSLPASVDPAAAWGETDHAILSSIADDLLPSPWREFFNNYEFLLNDTSVYPDSIYRELDPSEEPRHYIDLEIWDPSRPSTGTLPSAVELYYKDMVNAIKAGDWNKMFVAAGRLAHYVTDIHQPYHSTKNYWPIDAAGERLHSVIDRSIRGHLNEITWVRSYPLEPISNLTAYIFYIAWQSHSYLPLLNNTLLDGGKNHTAGRGWTAELTRMVENRSNTAIISIARVWHTAIQEASVTPPAIPTLNKLSVIATLPTTLSPTARHDLEFRVVDELGIRISGSPSAFVGPVQVKVTPPARAMDPFGRYVLTILPGQLGSYAGQTLVLKLSVERVGFQPAFVEKTVQIAGSQPETGVAVPTAGVPTIAVGIVLAAVVLLAVVILLRRRSSSAKAKGP